MFDKRAHYSSTLSPFVENNSTELPYQQLQPYVKPRIKNKNARIPDIHGQKLADMFDS